MKICILEDEEGQARQLTEFFHTYQRENPDFSCVLEVYDRAYKLLDAYSQDTDLALLDIRVPDMLGIEAARRIRQMDEKVMIIFVTNLAQYAIDGYSVNAFDYILKPLNYVSFSNKLQRAQRALSYRESGLMLDLKTREGQRRIPADSVTYIEVSAHDLYLHTSTETIRQWGTLSKYEELLRGAHFARCSTCYLVNLKYVTGIQKGQVLVGDAALTISRTRRKEFLQALAQYKGGSL